MKSEAFDWKLRCKKRPWETVALTIRMTASPTTLMMRSASTATAPFLRGTRSRTTTPSSRSTTRHRRSHRYQIT
ncbi:hypothetical protein Q7C36_012057 [Tachysurus vachellii]|uniref:Uncharacterized protein n=1 Tax=Tachysurus vachellii TaxID=175792 RepID=A0AA88SPS2_TACVA|nr:hypothetical protein Q7C36_012057 [Tachysurus vachellii]